jgi:hypothetical protein
VTARRQLVSVVPGNRTRALDFLGRGLPASVDAVLQERHLREIEGGLYTADEWAESAGDADA